MDSLRKYRVLAGACCASIFAVPAAAQNLSMHTLGEGIQGAAFVDAVYQHTNNVFYRSDVGSGSSGYMVKPYIQADFDGPTVNAEIHTTGIFSHYNLPTPFENYEDTYRDGLVAGKLDWTAGTRNFVSVNAQIQHSHDPIGTGRQSVLTLTNLPEVDADEWNETLVKGLYRFGAEDAALNIALGAAERLRTYVTNGPATDFLDFHSDNATGIVYFNYSPKTSFLLDLERNWTHFGNTDTASGSVSHDAADDLYRLGLQWRATAKTTGDIRIGYGTRHVDAIANTPSFISWQGSVVWNPGARTAFSFDAGRNRRESYLHNVAFLDEREFATSWNQRWGQRLGTWLTGRLIDADFVAPGGSVRHDRIHQVSFRAEYQLIKYVSLIGSVERAVRSSTFDSADYAAISSTLGVRLSI